MSFEYKGPPVKKKKEPEETGITRRSFLKASLALGTALVAGRVVSDYLEEKKETDIPKEVPRPGNKETTSKEPDPDSRKAESEEEIEPDMDYAESLSDILDFEKDGPIRLTPEKMKRVREYWKERYRKEPKLKESLRYAYREMGSWIKYLHEAFEKYEVPKNFAYLAIPESHWNVKKMVSKANAVGYYQITGNTGRGYGMKIGPVVDERMHPIKSADLCARYLKEWHDKAKGGRKDDCEEYWLLALATYNGSFAQTYINSCNDKKKDATYKEFLKTIEDKLNKIKDDLLGNRLTHVVGRWESLASIAKKYGISYKEFQRANALKGINVKRGQALVIPTAHLSQAAKKKVFAAAISGFSENLNYPEKFNAIDDLIKEKFVTQQNQPINLKPPYVVQQEAGVSDSYTHTIKRGETLSILSRKYGVKVKKIAEANKALKINNLKPGDKISIPDAKGKIRNKKAKSLITEAQKHRVSVSEMGFKNQHVRDWQKPLPNGTELWV